MQPLRDEQEWALIELNLGYGIEQAEKVLKRTDFLCRKGTDDANAIVASARQSLRQFIQYAKQLENRQVWIPDTTDYSDIRTVQVDENNNVTNVSQDW